MKPIDYFLLAVVVGCFLFAVLTSYKDRKNNKCDGNCANCKSQICNLDFVRIRDEVKNKKNKA